MSKFNPAEHRAGKWLKFNLAKPNELRLLVVKASGVRIAVIDSPEEIAALMRKAKQTASDGRLVGIFLKGGRLRMPGTAVRRVDDEGNAILDEAGNEIFDRTEETFATIPDSIAPQRTIEVNGHRNLEWMSDGGGEVHTMLIPFDGVRDVELLLTRDDIPTKHNETLHSEFDPKETRRR